MIESIGFYGFCNGRILAARSLHEKYGEILLSADIQKKGCFTSIQPYLKNEGAQEALFGRAFVRIINTPGPYEYFSQYNRWGQEENGKWAPLDGRGVCLGHLQGRTTEGNTPFCALREIGQKAGAAFHIYPMGNWRIRILPLIDTNSEPKIAVDLGQSDEEMHLRLAPGETFALPEILIQQFDEFEPSMADLHRYVLQDARTSTRPLPVVFNTWFDRFDELTLPHLRESLKAAAEVGCETFVIDAGWFGGNVPGWWECIGDWRHEKTSVAPEGWVAQFAEEVRAAGLQFGLWMEPERMHPSVGIAKEHPDWFVYCPATTFMRYRLENPETARFLEQEIEDLIAKYDLKYIKTDMNMLLGEDDTGCELSRYQRIFYEIIDRIRMRHPDLILENCSSGAMRTDLETFRHFDGVFPSDNVNPWTILDTIHGLWRRGLPGRVMRWNTIAEASNPVPSFGHEKTAVMTPSQATWEEAEKVDLESLLIANFNTGMYGFSGDIASLTPSSRKLVAEYIALFKEKRNFLLKAAGHFLVDTPRLKVIELEKDGDALVQVIYMAQDAARCRKVFPVNLRSDAIYTCGKEKRTGEDIMRNGLDVELFSFMHTFWRATQFWLEQQH